MKNKGFVFVLGLAALMLVSMGKTDQERKHFIAETELLAEGIFKKPLGELCKLFENPLTAEGSINPHYQLEPDKAKARIEHAESLKNEYGSFEVPLSDRDSHITRHLDDTIQRLGLSDSKVTVRVFDQFQLCSDRADALFSEVKWDLLPEAGRRDAFATKMRNINQCLIANMAIANFSVREIYIGDWTLKKLTPLQQSLVLTHELCHIEVPAIRGRYNEEFFCDSWAHDQLKKFLSTDDVLTLPQAHYDALIGNANHSDFITLRAGLPLACSQLNTPLED